MRAMLIDDEKPALMHLERLLRADGRIEPAALCMSAREGLERLAQEPFDAVFLDIGMPEMNGLEAAEYIQQAYPGIAILFVTAYSEYAVEAFELQAIDYLLKPIGAPRLRRTIDRLVPPGPETSDAADKGEAASSGSAAGTVSGLSDSIERTGGSPASSQSAPSKPSSNLEILMFRRLELADAQTGEPRPLKWRTAKVQELLAYLLHPGEQWVRRDDLIECIWPDVPMEKASTHLHTSVYQLRKMLKEWAPQMKLEYRQESYRLLRGGAAVDVERFEREGSSLLTLTDAPNRMPHLKRLLSLWRGGYLEHHDYEWAGARASELKRLRVQLALTLADWERQAGQYEEAVRLLSSLREEDPFAEGVGRLLMRTYADAGDQRGLRESYQLLRERLSEDLGVEPEQQTQQLYERLQHEQNAGSGRKRS
ncbi:hypothetical protein B9G55_09035 [Saccharibacillus sp. O16]|nr:hypothetical protein B9G55_09035 [Saccharibacillus sp. O16]